jgi:hypothetical protein
VSEHGVNANQVFNRRWVCQQADHQRDGGDDLDDNHRNSASVTANVQEA